MKYGMSITEAAHIVKKCQLYVPMTPHGARRIMQSKIFDKFISFGHKILNAAFVLIMRNMLVRYCKTCLV